MTAQGGTTSTDRVLAIAMGESVESAGGAHVIAREIGRSITQVYRYTSTNDIDNPSLRNAVMMDKLAGDNPAIVRAIARILGFSLVKLPDAAEDEDGLMQSVCELSAELGDVSRSIGSALRDGKVTRKEALAAIAEVDQLQDTAATLRAKLVRIAEGAAR